MKIGETAGNVKRYNVVIYMVSCNYRKRQKTVVLAFWTQGSLVRIQSPRPIKSNSYGHSRSGLFYSSNQIAISWKRFTLVDGAGQATCPPRADPLLAPIQDGGGLKAPCVPVLHFSSGRALSPGTQNGLCGPLCNSLYQPAPNAVQCGCVQPGRREPP